MDNFSCAPSSQHCHCEEAQRADVAISHTPKPPLPKGGCRLRRRGDSAPPGRQRLPCAKGAVKIGYEPILTEGLSQYNVAFLHWFSANSQCLLHNPSEQNQRFCPPPFTQGRLFLRTTDFPLSLRGGEADVAISAPPGRISFPRGEGGPPTGGSDEEFGR